MPTLGYKEDRVDNKTRSAQRPTGKEAFSWLVPDIAMQYGDLKAIRAVAGANGKNKIAIIIPCHRVIGSNQSLVGYAGGLNKKRWLLQHEAKYALGVQQIPFSTSDLS
jgi:O-6-methylguanine DNA methyltransferase